MGYSFIIAILCADLIGELVSSTNAAWCFEWFFSNSRVTLESLPPPDRISSPWSLCDEAWVNFLGLEVLKTIKSLIEKSSLLL